MKRLLFLAVVAIVLAVPASAQAPRTVGGGMASPTTAGGGGAAGFSGGGSGSGTTSVNKLPSCPVTRFGVASVSGSKQLFVPSTFLSYDKAVTAGETVISTPAPSVAEAARQQSAASAHTEKAKFVVIQNYYGYPTVVPR